MSTKRYMLGIHQPDGDPPPPEMLDPIMRDIAALQEEMRSAGVWVFSAGLLPPSTATVVQWKDGDVVTTDGPYTEGKEHLGGFTIIETTDLDDALIWGRKLAEALRSLPVEVWPLEGGSC